MSQNNFFKSSLPLLLVIFIDSMGLGLVFPILNALLVEKQFGEMQGIWQHLSSNTIYGIFIGAFMLSWFLGAAILGDLSDQIGRKRSLFICLLGSFLGYLFSALAIVGHSMALLFIGRIIAGLTSGSQPIAQAAVIDISTEENKTQNIGLMLMMASFGFILGPMIGGTLSDNHLVSWFNLSTPFYFSALVSLLNVALLLKMFKETFRRTGKIVIKPHLALTVFVSAFQNIKVRKLSCVFFIFILGWSSFYSFISMYLSESLHFGTREVTFFMALMGAGFAIGNGYGVNYLVKRFSLKTNILWTLVFGSFLILLMLCLKGPILWGLIVVLAATVAVAYSCLVSLFSSQVDKDSQGWVMGVSGSIMAFTFGIDGLILGALAAMNIHLPMMISIVSFLLSTILFLNFKGNQAEGSAEISHVL